MNHPVQIGFVPEINTVYQSYFRFESYSYGTTLFLGSHLTFPYLILIKPFSFPSKTPNPSDDSDHEWDLVYPPQP